MGKIKTLTKRGKFSENILKKRSAIKPRATSITFEEFSPTAELASEEFIAKVLWECLKENDIDGVIETLRTFIEARNKLQMSRDEHIARSTVYDSLKSGANPTLKTLGKLIHSCFGK